MTNQKERREYDREVACIPFIYSRDSGRSLSEGEWREAKTLDIGPVLVGGLGFETTEEFAIGDPMRVALFMDLHQKEVWVREQVGLPVIYHAKVMRIVDREGQRRVGVEFGGFADRTDEEYSELSSEEAPE